MRWDWKQNPRLHALEASLGGRRVHIRRSMGGAHGVERFAVDCDGTRCFVKLAPSMSVLRAEADGLQAIAATCTLRTPRVLAMGPLHEERSGDLLGGFLVLDWIDLHDDGDWRAAGAGLAMLHAAPPAVPRFGWEHDNYLGASRQRNGWSDDWREFWRERRLRPQFRMAREAGLDLLASRETAALAASDRLLSTHAPHPSLLHGDLWSGNMGFDAQGAPVLFEPAVYVGDAEADLAMTRLFGGIPAEFYRAYEVRHTPAPGWQERDALYRLYHVLNHANLFGGSYVTQAARLIDQL